MRDAQFVAGFTIISVVSLISIISCMYVCLSILFNGYLSCPSITKSKHNVTINNQYKHSIMTIVIFWICITDGILGIRCLLLYTPQIFVPSIDWFYGRYNDIMCNIISIVDIFCRIQNSLWHIILAYNFLYLLRLKSLEKLLKHQNKYHYFIVMIVR